jgi:hypothetical protein
MGRTNMRTEAQQLAALRAAIKHKGPMGKGEWDRFRRSASSGSKGWPVARLDAWAVRMIEAKVLRPTLAFPEVKWQAIRDAHTAATHPSAPDPLREQRELNAAVTNWIVVHTNNHLHAAHLASMKDNLRRESLPVLAIEAVVSIMEEEGTITLEDRIRGPLAAPRPKWRQEAWTWARIQGWKVPQGDPRTQTRIPKESVVVELGTGYEGATEGLRVTYSRVVSVDLMRQPVVAKERKSVPDILVTFQAAAQRGKETGGAAFWVAQQAQVLKGELAAIWASPSCQEGSIAQGLNKNKGSGAGPYSGQNFSDDSMQGLMAVLKAITEARKKDPSIQYVMEQPAQSAVKDLKEVREELGVEGLVVQGCAYGERKSGKKYILWMSPETRAMFSPVLPASPESKCEDCKAGKKHSQGMCPRKGSGQERVHLEGMTNAAARNRVPPGLAEHLGWVMRAARAHALQEMQNQKEK